MSYALTKNPNTTRSGLLALVVGGHLFLVVLLMTTKAVAPHMAEIPLIVDLLQEAPEQPKAKPLPVAKPQPVLRNTTPKPHSPILEASNTTVPSVAPEASEPTKQPATVAAPATETVSQARFDADYLKNPAPPYPPLSRRMGEEGKVVLRVSVSPQGNADSVEIKTSSGSNRLDESAAKTVRTWRFVPAKRGEIAIQSWVLVPIIFKLEQ